MFQTQPELVRLKVTVLSTVDEAEQPRVPGWWRQVGPNKCKIRAPKVKSELRLFEKK